MPNARNPLVPLVISAACALAGGCSWLQHDAQVVPERSFRGPPMSLDSSGRVHVVSMQAPNPGWNLELDRAQEAAGPTQLLMSVRRPDPAYLYTQQIVEKSVASRTRTTDPVEVYARVIDHAEKDSDVPYERVLLGTGPE